MGKEKELEVPTLPQTVVQGFGGYHSARISQESHNMFEEIPSLGIAGDMLMAAASADEEPERNFPCRITNWFRRDRKTCWIFSSNRSTSCRN
jgi:hypothetical protein